VQNDRIQTISSDEKKAILVSFKRLKQQSCSVETYTEYWRSQISSLPSLVTAPKIVEFIGDHAMSVIVS
jgi:predicted nucleic-acid-binding Zn-ribbon protein